MSNENPDIYEIVERRIRYRIFYDNKASNEIQQMGAEAFVVDHLENNCSDAEYSIAAAAYNFGVNGDKYFSDLLIWTLRQHNPNKDIRYIGEYVQKVMDVMKNGDNTKVENTIIDYARLINKKYNKE